MASAMRPKALGAVSALSFSSGLPYGLVVTAIPTWMAMEGFDIATIGLVGLLQLPYALKPFWAPLVDRLALPRPFPRGRRGWIALSQLLLAASIGLLALHASGPKLWVVALVTVLVALFSATQDIAVDGYAVELLEPREQGAAVGARTAMYRASMWLTANAAITLAASPALFQSAGEGAEGTPLGWSPTFGLVALAMLALLPCALFAPSAGEREPAPTSLKEAVLGPVAGFLKRGRALEICGFLLLYKLADNLAFALVRPFLVQWGYNAFEVGVASGAVGLIATLAGTFLGGLCTNLIGLGRALWLFGAAQALANIGYALVASTGLNRELMFGAIALDQLASGLGTGAFGVLLMRLTERRFGATQYALFSSIFALGRTLALPLAGGMVALLGWRYFFFATILFSIPGLFMLHRFVPWGRWQVEAAVDVSGKS